MDSAANEWLRHAQDRPGVTSVTSQTRRGRRGCRIEKRFPTSTPGASSPLASLTEGVHSGHRPTSVKTAQTAAASASISTWLSIFMYQMVHEYWAHGKGSRHKRPIRTV